MSDSDFLHEIILRNVFYYSQEDVDTVLSSAVARAVNHKSNEVKCVAALGVQHIASKELSLCDLKVDFLHLTISFLSSAHTTFCSIFETSSTSDFYRFLSQ